MASYNYKEKLEHRNKLLDNIKINSKNTLNLTSEEWYKTFMPFLPKGKIYFYFF
jgi:hypothetical protein